jgi:hypothetical protein
MTRPRHSRGLRACRHRLTNPGSASLTAPSGPDPPATDYKTRTPPANSPGHTKPRPPAHPQVIRLRRRHQAPRQPDLAHPPIPLQNPSPDLPPRRRLVTLMSHKRPPIRTLRARGQIRGIRGGSLGTSVRRCCAVKKAGVSVGSYRIGRNRVDQPTCVTNRTQSECGAERTPCCLRSGREEATILLRKRKRSSLNPMHALTIVFRHRANPSSAGTPRTPSSPRTDRAARSLDHG